MIIAFCLAPITRYPPFPDTVCAIDLFVDDDPSFSDFAFYNSIFFRWNEKKVINLTRFTWSIFLKTDLSYQFSLRKNIDLQANFETV